MSSNAQHMLASVGMYAIFSKREVFYILEEMWHEDVSLNLNLINSLVFQNKFVVIRIFHLSGFCQTLK